MKIILMLIAISLIGHSAVALADFNFQLNNPTNEKLVLLEWHNISGGIYLPLYILRRTSENGHSTSSGGLSEGNFSYGKDSSNYCSVTYNQLFGRNGEYFYRATVKSVGKIFCKSQTDPEQANHKIIDFHVYPA